MAEDDMYEELEKKLRKTTSGADSLSLAEVLAEKKLLDRKNEFLQKERRRRRDYSNTRWWQVGSRIKLSGGSALARIGMGFSKHVAYRWRKFRPLRFLFILLIIVTILFLGYSIFMSTALGTQLGSDVTVLGGDVREAGQALTGPLNVLGEILTGRYDVTTLWTSEIVEDEYDQIARDVGVKAVALRTQRPVYFPVPDEEVEDSKIVIDGLLQVNNPPGEETTVEVNVNQGKRSEQCETKGGGEGSTNLPGYDIGGAAGEGVGNGTSASGDYSQGEVGGSVGGTGARVDINRDPVWCDVNWECFILGSDTNDNKITISDRRKDTRFFCERRGVAKSAGLDQGFSKVFLADVEVTYDTIAYTGRQIFVVDRLEADKVFVETGRTDLAALSEPILGIPSSETIIQKSWQKGDESANLALGIFGQDEGILIAADDFKQPLGIRLGNPVFAGSNLIADIHNVSIAIPYGFNGLAFEPGRDFESDRDLLDTENRIEWYVNRRDIGRQLEAGEDIVLNWDVIANETFLGGAPFSSFFILGEAKFQMKTSEAVEVHILGVDPISE